MVKLKLFGLVVLLCIVLIGCSSGSTEDAAVNADISKPGEKMPPGLDQAQGAGGQGSASAPAAAQTGP